MFHVLIKKVCEYRNVPDTRTLILRQNICIDLKNDMNAMRITPRRVHLIFNEFVYSDVDRVCCVKTTTSCSQSQFRCRGDSIQSFRVYESVREKKLSIHAHIIINAKYVNRCHCYTVSFSIRDLCFIHVASSTASLFLLNKNML